VRSFNTAALSEKRGMNQTNKASHFLLCDQSGKGPVGLYLLYLRLDLSKADDISQVLHFSLGNSTLASVDSQSSCSFSM